MSNASPTRSALLIGVPESKDPRLHLPVIRSDFRELRSALQAAGFEVVNPFKSSQEKPTGNNILTETRAFCRNSTAETLLLYVSGHGLHYQGTDYLLPYDFSLDNLDEPDLDSLLVPIDKLAAASQHAKHARNVILFHDACREEIKERVEDSGNPDISISQQQQVPDFKDRNLAYVYGCSPDEVCYYKYREGEDSYSYLSRALTTVLDASEDELFGDVLDGVGRELRQLSEENGKEPQVPRVNSASKLGQSALYKLVLCPKPDASEFGDDDEWSMAVEGSRLWDFVREADESNTAVEAELRRRTRQVVQQCRALWERSCHEAAYDPWRDENLPLRVAEYTELLVSESGVKLYPAETALLLAAPFVREGVLAAQVSAFRAEADPYDVRDTGTASGLRGRLETTYRSMAQHVRRAQRLKEGGKEKKQAHDAVASWLLHRCIFRLPTLWKDRQDLFANGEEESRMGVSHEALSPSRLIAFARWVGGDAGRLENTDNRKQVDGLQDEVTLGVRTPYRTTLREKLVGGILALAGRLGVDVRTLSDVLVEHVGQAHFIDPDTIVPTVRELEWPDDASGWTAEVVCSHPAIDAALREHVRGADACLSHLKRMARRNATLTALSGLPGRLSDYKIEAVEEENGTPAYERPHLRFEVDPNEVQELLMGKQLYGDPELAIRELYQNALDACRYRKARQAYLVQEKDRTLPEWKGRIIFRQGVEDGREYVQCEDNGIGMSRTELRRTFAKAGRRFADLPDFIEEQADWQQAEPPIEMWPNSQFGIGVFSYFMLADELEIITCRLDRDGRPGETLLVDVTGSGSLFHVRPAPASQSRDNAGTRIRLYLRPDIHDAVEGRVSCVETLREILWVAEFPTEARHESDVQTWEPGVLHGSTVPERRRGRVEVVTVPSEHDVWWVRRGDVGRFPPGESLPSGRVLSDGLQTSERVPGAVVNLRGAQLPTLSVDRKDVIDYDRRHVEDLLTKATAALAENPEWLTMEWMWGIGKAAPEIAHFLTETLLDTDSSVRIRLRGGIIHSIPLADAGCFPFDEYLFRERGGIYSGKRGVPERLLASRIHVYEGISSTIDFPGSSPNGLKIDRRLDPFDFVLLNSVIERVSRGQRWIDRVDARHVLHAVHGLDLPAEEILRRLRELAEAFDLEMAVDVEAVQEGEWRETDRHLLSRNLDGVPPWIDRVDAVHVRRVLHNVDRPAEEVVGRLRELAEAFGLKMAPVDVEAVQEGEWTETARRLLSRRLDGRWPWIDRIDAGHVLRVLHKLGRPAEEVVGRLQELAEAFGLKMAAVDVEAVREGEWTETDRRLLSRDLDGVPPWIDRIDAGHVLRVLRKLGRPAVEVVARLRELAEAFGLEMVAVDVEAVPEGEWTETDRRLISRDLDGRWPWIDRIDAGHVLQALHELDRPAEEVVGRLRELAEAFGLEMTVEVEAVQEGEWTETDRRLLSRRLDGRPPWIDRVDAVHVLRVLHELDRPAEEVVARLRELAEAFGLEMAVEAEAVQEGEWTETDRRLLSRNFNGRAPWIDRIDASHTLQAILRLDQSAGEIVARLRELAQAFGLEMDAVDVEALDAFPFTDEDWRLLSRDFDGDPPYVTDVTEDRLVIFAWYTITPYPELVEQVRRLEPIGVRLPDSVGEGG
jgi:nucleotide-binding universal stress UspA family protein